MAIQDDWRAKRLEEFQKNLGKEEAFRAKSNEQRRALRGHFDDFLYGMNPRREDPSPPSQATQPAVQSLAGELPTATSSAMPRPPLLSAQAPGSPAIDYLTRPWPRPVKTDGSQAKTGDSQTTPIPVGRYGWKGTSESVNGNPTLVFGTPGSDNSGVGSWRPGSARAVQALSSGRQPSLTLPQSASSQARDALVSGNVTSRPSPLDISHQTWLDHSGTGEQQKWLQLPKYLTREEGRSVGLGWKGRLAKYKTDMDAYNRATGNLAALDLEAMREAGAGQRSLLHAKSANDANEIAMQRLASELPLNQARIETERLNQQRGQMDLGMAQRMQNLADQMEAEQDPLKRRALRSQLLALQGKADNPRYQIVTREGVDPETLQAVRTPYAIDPETRESFEVGGADGGPDQAMQIVLDNPAYQKAYSEASPEKQKEMLDKVRERLRKMQVQ